MAEQRRILVTGAASGIGRAIATRFHAGGWLVGLADVDEGRLAAAAAALPGAVPLRLDVRDRAGWRSVLAAFAGEPGAGGRLDALVNNAGIGAGGAFAALDLDAADRVVAVNFMGVVNGARLGHAALAATPGSCLLNVASASAIYGAAGLALYSATKFAVRGLTEALDGEWRRDGVRVAALLPGFVDTPLLDVAVAGPGGERPIRAMVAAAGMELTDAATVAEAAWAVVTGDGRGGPGFPIGPTARRLTRAARWWPGLLRRRMRRR